MRSAFACLFSRSRARSRVASSPGRCERGRSTAFASTTMRLRTAGRRGCPSPPGRRGRRRGSPRRRLRETQALAAHLALELRDDLDRDRRERDHAREELERLELLDLVELHLSGHQLDAAVAVVVDQQHLHSGDVVAGDDDLLLLARVLVQVDLVLQGGLRRHVDAVEDQVGARDDVLDVLRGDPVVVQLEGRVRVDLLHPLDEDRRLVAADILQPRALAVHVGDVVAVGLGEDQVLAAEPNQRLDRRAADRAATRDEDRRRAEPLLLLRGDERRVPRRQLTIELVVGRKRGPVAEDDGVSVALTAQSNHIALRPVGRRPVRCDRG